MSYDTTVLVAETLSYLFVYVLGLALGVGCARFLERREEH